MALFKLQKSRIQKDRDTLSKKQEAAKKLYEDPSGQRFTADQINDILEREEKVSRKMSLE